MTSTTRNDCYKCSYATGTHGLTYNQLHRGVLVRYERSPIKRHTWLGLLNSSFFTTYSVTTELRVHSYEYVEMNDVIVNVSVRV